jgi:hypothetical protein
MLNEEIQHTQIAERIRNLHIRRKEILSLPAEKALDEILDSPQPAAMVHSFPEEDFFFLIHDIGVEDSIELLSLASDRQWEYIFDVEIWERDKISMNAVTQWLDLLLRADPDRVIRWLLKDKLEMTEFYLFKNVEVMVREHDQDPSDFGEGFFTVDDVFYIRLIDEPYDHQLEDKEKRDEVASEILHRLAMFDHVIYQRVLFEFMTVQGAEAEEEAFRLRNQRLAEKGFMPFDEAVGIYQPLKVNDLKDPGYLKRLRFSHEAQYETNLYAPVPFYSVGMLKQDNLFTRSLQEIKTDEILQQLQSEFASLCNQIISADQKIIREREELRGVVKKACGYVSLGLEHISVKYSEKAVNRSAALIQKIPLSRIFRVGYGFALRLKWRAQKWQKQSWFSQENLPLSFWGEEWLGVLGGLLIKKPLYFDNYKTGVIYREFESLNDIRETETVLSEIMAADRLFSLMKISPVPVPGRFVTYKNFMLTLWARHCLALTQEPLPVKSDEFKNFFEELWERGSGFEVRSSGNSADLEPRKVKTSAKESFLKWLSDASGEDIYDITRQSGRTLETLFQEIESEYGEVSTKHLKSKYISLFLVRG